MTSLTADQSDVGRRRALRRRAKHHVAASRSSPRDIIGPR